MTEQDFLDELERRFTRALSRREGNPKYGYCPDGFVILGLPNDPNVPVTGVAWTLGAKVNKNALKISLSHKAYERWRHGDFEPLLPPVSGDNWFNYDAASASIVIRLHVR